MKPEYIIIAVIVVFAIYIFIQSSISGKKLQSPSKDDKKDGGKVELKTVVAPKVDSAELERKAREADEAIMKKAAMENMEYEKSLKQKEQEKHQEKNTSVDEEKQYTQTLVLMRKKMEQIYFNEEEKDFIDEVEELSPRLKAILFAELLSKHGVDPDNE